MWIDRLMGDTQAKLLLALRRSRHTIASLMEELRLTDNAVRSHVASLERSGIIRAAGMQRDTGGKPARVYALTHEGEELFPKAYALVLGALVDEISRQEGKERAIALLEAVGERVGSGVTFRMKQDMKVSEQSSGSGASSTPPAGVRAAAAALIQLGAELDVVRQDDGWRIQGHACPLSAVTSDRPEVCALARALVEQVTGQPVTECCDRGESPRCAFFVPEARSA